MGRWRPPAEPSSPYITAQGAQRLKQELQQLWRQERPEVVRALSAAAAEGDRSENAEYIYRKKQLGGIDRRIRYLSKRLDQCKVIDRTPADTSTVRFGAWLQLLDGQGEQQQLRIVGADETDARLGWISIDSPLARALLGKQAGADVDIQTPQGRQAWTLLAVSYEPPGEQ
jgi:transcription elongation factor GreB